jgi:hypothetical protein
MQGEIGFKILGADARQAVPDLMRIYERTVSMDSPECMESQVAVSRSLIDIGPPAIPALIKWAVVASDN